MKKPYSPSGTGKKPAAPTRKTLRPAPVKGLQNKLVPSPLKKLTQTPKRVTPALASAAAKKEALKRFRPNK
jgi:hypothetical protein